MCNERFSMHSGLEINKNDSRRGRLTFTKLFVVVEILNWQRLKQNKTNQIGEKLWLEEYFSATKIWLVKFLAMTY